MTLTKKLIAILFALVLIGAASAQNRTANQITSADKFTYTGYPLYGTTVTPNDSADLTQPGYIRVNALGQVTAACIGNGAGNQITLDLVAGEFFPCLVSRVYDTGTDSITIHVFY